MTNDDAEFQSSRTLAELLEMVSSKAILRAAPAEDRGLAESLPFPFMAMIGQSEMRTALVLVAINPAIGGALLLGPRGTGKTTAVRALVDLLPSVPRSLCPYGCLPEDIETDGIDAVCPDCARKYGEGQPLTYPDQVRLIELPLTTNIDDLIGSINEQGEQHGRRLSIRRGILANSDRNVLYIDEVNLLADELVDAILDAAAQGQYTVRRGLLRATYRSRFALVGSMNPEEGRLRPQILDRFGLRVIVAGLNTPEERYEAYQRVRAFRRNPRAFINEFWDITQTIRNEIEAAAARLPQVEIGEAAVKTGLSLVQALKIDSLRAEITLFEAARAYAAADSRDEVSPTDIRKVAPLALRMRRSAFMESYFQSQAAEDAEIAAIIDNTLTA